ncbi:hypothetical protein [Devosia sp. SL43]|uniref:hypothetical protein n=1 Tax=Devosia sp. SL43 TaxID=2806348 RepID=UPI001F31A676|nr:hypothetical protein [Devosia sp. SL43]UJW84650.1 hypothetical protein IM737_14620 [Devosia sp. SL43]
MRRVISFFGLACALAFAIFAAAQPAMAQSPIDSYCAQISDNDKFASDGYALSDAGSILRQDRANFHRFGTPDAEDYGDSTFDSSSAREKIPAMLDAGEIEPGLARDIVRGYPYVCVDVYPRFLTVYYGQPSEPEYDDIGYPFIGDWDCEVTYMSFSSTTYNNGSEDIPILEIQEGSDGSYTLLFEGDYWITLSPNGPNGMAWFSGESGDSFNCTRL